MSMRSALILGLLALLAAAPSAAAAERRVPRGFYGVVWDQEVAGSSAAVKAEQFGLMASTGVESVRTVFSWADAQPEAGQQPSFARTDELVANAAVSGIGLLPVVMYAPRWARRNPEVGTSPPARPADYGAFLARLVGRYGPRGSFWAERSDLPRRPLRRWQIWNEPHLQYQWTVHAREGGRFPHGYVALLRAAHASLSRSDSRARVVLAGLTNDSWNHLRALYRAGARRWFDLAAVQTYTAAPRRVVMALRRVRAVMSKAGDRGKPVLLTEMSWPAARGRTRVPSYHRRIVTSDAGMARRLTAGYRLVVRDRRRYRVGGLFWYTWASSYRPGSIFSYSGLGRFDDRGYQPRSAWRAYRRSARRDQGCAKDRQGRCR
ncbi:MAG TPA: hypothetical protein VHG69_08245 [Thermoleophilaceae bacterium]|nr:hypothetical protein [Thermoleophilaceae bacterium]